MSTNEPRALWTPTAETIANTRLNEFAQWVSARRSIDFGTPTDYDLLWQWSVKHVDQFWADVSMWSGLFLDVEDREVLTDSRMPGSTWFPDRTINYARRALCSGNDGAIAVIAVGESRPPVEITWKDLRQEVGALAATFRQLGVRPGDRVAGYLPNIPEAMTAFLAAASLGAVWTVCAPDFGAQSVLDRLEQVEPTVLVAVDGYRFNGKEYDRRDVVDEFRSHLPGLRGTVLVRLLDGTAELSDAISWTDATSDKKEPDFVDVPFDHPLWIVYSSGTTGRPKGIVHGHGGVVLEQIKQATMHNDLAPGDRFYWYASTAWIMWNITVSALLSGVTVILHDGGPAYPTADAQFDLAERFGISYLGTSAGYLTACERQGIVPRERYRLEKLRSIGSTGSPLPASTFEWVYTNVKTDVVLTSTSGGTDVAGGFIGGSPLLPVIAGELQRPMLGVAATAWNAHGEPVIDEMGELVITSPMPSMPLFFWDDPNGERYSEAYFDLWPGVWRHGDWLEITHRGTCRIMGRSDSTLNRGGVRMGTADIYAALDRIPEVIDSLVLGVEQSNGEYWMPLFVATTSSGVDDELARRINEAIRATASPRHMPDEIIAVPSIPHTRTGKRLEVPLKRLFQGIPAPKTLNPSSIDDPDALTFFIDLARARTTNTEGRSDV